jgi:hypothetical protein
LAAAVVLVVQVHLIFLEQVVVEQVLLEPIQLVILAE